MNRPSWLVPLVVLLLVSMGSPAAGASVDGATWVKQSPIPTHESINGIDMIDANEGWAVGGGLIGQGPLAYEGFVLHTTNGGATWSHQDIPTPEHLNAVKFIDPLHGWALGNDVLLTEDGGATWNEVNAELGGVLGVDFVDLNRGWAASNGGVISRTVDGGRTWTWTATGTIETLKDVDFVDASNGWVVGVNGIILHTTDGGENWVEIPSPADYLDGVAFVSPLEGWVAGGDTVLHTTDGGASWQRQPTPGAWVYSMSFADSLHGWIVGEDVLATVDGGETWEIQDIDTPDRLWGVDAVSASNVVIVGQGGGLFTTVDGGATWVNRLNGMPETTLGIDANDSLHAWAAGQYGETAYTVDGGSTWVRVPIDTFGDLDAVDFLSDNTTGWAVGSNSIPQSVIYRSNDGGAAWTHQFTGGDYTQFYGVAAISRRVAVAVGSHGIWRTTDGGLSWSLPHPPVTGLFSDVEFRGPIGFAVGNNGSILRSADGGATWTDVSPHLVGDPPLMGVSFADRRNGWAVGFYGTMVRTRDGGRSWREFSIPGLADATFLSVSAVGPSTAWVAVGSEGIGLVARTTDGGATWTKEILPGGAFSANAVAFLSADQGWAGGGVGIWYRTA
jgi:photosystem II stability/assembly factor-like uncharacterized protein